MQAPLVPDTRKRDPRPYGVGEQNMNAFFASTRASGEGKRSTPNRRSRNTELEGSTSLHIYKST